MAIELAISNANLELSWAFTDALDLATVRNAGTLSHQTSLATGTAADKADRIWHDSRTVNAGANDDLDLTALTMSLFGSTVTITLAKLKGIYLVNLNTVAGDVLRFDSSVTNGHTGAFGGSNTAKVECGEDDCLKIGNKKSGWTVDGTHKVLRITNPGSNNINYKIALFGTSA